MTTNSRTPPAEANKTGVPPGAIHIPVAGFPGELHSMVFTNIFDDANNHLNLIPPGGIPGQYKVTFVMGKPGIRGFPDREIRFADFMRGDSHLAILAPAFPAPAEAEKIRIEIKVDSESLVLDGLPNEAGFLAKLETHSFHAENHNDAELRATRIVQGLLSEYSAQLDIPLQIDLVEVTELVTYNKRLTLVAPFNTGGSSAPIDQYDREFANLAGLYREGLLSNSPAYRFLCFYKILEVSKKRRGRMGRKSAKDNSSKRYGERIPESPGDQILWLQSIFPGQRRWPQFMLNQIFVPEVRGKKLTALFDAPLRKLRDRIAHGILDSGHYLLVDDPSAVREISRWLPFLRCAVRRALKNDFPEHYLAYISKDGSVNSGP
jgi:hypothetical protein